MKKMLRCLYFICFIFLVGCNELSKYDDTDVVAIVRGEEITIGELRFLFPDETVLEQLDGTIKAKLAIQEAKKMNLDVSEELQEIKKMNNFYPPEDEDSEFANGIREFANTQSKKLGMEPEEYYKQYLEITEEISVYVVAYLAEMLGEPEGGAVGYNEKANKVLDELVEKNETDIKILIE